jgi:hypothetical protein
MKLKNGEPRPPLPNWLRTTIVIVVVVVIAFVVIGGIITLINNSELQLREQAKAAAVLCFNRADDSFEVFQSCLDDLGYEIDKISSSS